ncbi:DnaD domain-containing protein [Cytobacillus sp. FSL R7-0680]|uniref:DnaD domain-containing protein n=1 Tax=Cytobacillus sp. FSL R7-0680 TaxID=2921689 RepID=UPI0030F7304A
MKGAFQVSREIFENEIWSDVLKFRVFFYILGKAIFSQDGIEHAGIKIERGQYLRSLRNLQDDLAYKEGRGNALKKPPLETLRRKIKSLENEGRITTKSTEYGTLFTVVNYAKYQGFEHYKNQSMGQKWDSNETAMGQQRDNNKNVNKDNNVKEKNTTTTTDHPIKLFEDSLCRLSPLQMQSLNQWIDDFKGNQEIVNAAIKLADDKNKKNFNFVNFILKEWHSHNLMEIDRVRAHEREKFNKNKVKPFARKGKGVIRTEMLPDWFEEDAQQSKPKPSDQPAVNDGEQMSEFERLMELRKNSGS